MGTIDTDAYIKAHKALVIIFIISIILANFLLILKTACRSGFIYRPRSLTLISLAIGDIFLAVFSLVVWAKIYYGDAEDLNCRTVNSSAVYQEFLIHFVYGVGLIVLAVELVHRYKRQFPESNTFIDFAKSIFCSAIPWIIGLSVVLPITMAKESMRRGYMFSLSCLIVSEERYLAVYSVSVVLPVCLALLACFAVMCVRFRPVQYTSLVNHPGTTQGVINYAVDNKQMLTSQNNCDNNQKIKLEGPEFTAPNAQYPPPPYPQQLGQPPLYTAEHLQPPPYAAQYPQPHYIPQQQTAQLNSIILGPVYSVNQQPPATFQDPRKEKVALLLVAIFLFFCVMPLVVYRMIIVHDLDINITRSDNTIVQASFFWLSLFRSIITPIIWIGYYKN